MKCVYKCRTTFPAFCPVVKVTSCWLCLECRMSANINRIIAWIYHSWIARVFFFPGSICNSFLVSSNTIFQLWKHTPCSIFPIPAKYWKGVKIGWNVFIRTPGLISSLGGELRRVVTVKVLLQISSCTMNVGHVGHWCSPCKWDEMLFIVAELPDHRGRWILRPSLLW